MTNVNDDNLQPTQAWFSSNMEMQGEGCVRLQGANTEIFGHATISTDPKLKILVKLQSERIAPKTASPPETPFEQTKYVDMEVKTSNGRFKASRVYCLEKTSVGSDNRGQFLFSTYDAELTVSNEKPVYWALPLSNFLSNFRRSSDQLRAHPLRIKSDQWVIPFEWEGRSAYIEPLLDYIHRVKMLEGGDERNLLTAIMVGELGDHLTDAESVMSWFPDTLLWVLSVATGNEIGAPWVEFRDSNGNLVKRLYRHLGAPPLTGGRRVIEEFLGGHTGNLLNSVLSTPFCQKPVYRVLLHHALRASADGQTVDDRLSHLFRAFDRLCKEHDIKPVFLQRLLTEPAKTSAIAVLEQAYRDLNIFAIQAQAAGDIGSQEALELIAKRVKSADQTENDFGKSVCTLAQKFGFHDEAAMNTHLAANPLSPNITSWRSALSEYRNVNTHDAFHDTSDPAHAFDKLYGMNLHLLDLLVRILLEMSGYTGPYRPAHAILRGTQKALDWVQPNTPVVELGYGNLI